MQSLYSFCCFNFILFSVEINPIFNSFLTSTNTNSIWIVIAKQMCSSRLAQNCYIPSHFRGDSKNPLLCWNSVRCVRLTRTEDALSAFFLSFFLFSLPVFFSLKFRVLFCAILPHSIKKFTYLKISIYKMAIVCAWDTMFLIAFSHKTDEK